MRCEVCNEGPLTTGVSLIRVNEFGVEGIWRCRKCATPEQLAKRDPETAKLVEIIEQDNQSRALRIIEELKQ